MNVVTATSSETEVNIYLNEIGIKAKIKILETMTKIKRIKLIKQEKLNNN